MLTATIDLSGMESVMDGLRDALIATGRSGDAAKLTEDTARQLSLEIANDLAPKNRANAEAKIQRDVGRFLSVPWNENIEEENRGDGGMIWLVAGPRFLYGVREQDYDLRNTNTQAALLAMRQEQRSGVTRSKSMIQLGSRGRQTLYRKDRIIVPRAAFRGAVRSIVANLGRLAASFAETAKKLGSGNIKAIMEKHFPSPKNIHEDHLSDSESPHITFGSRSPGVSKPFVQDVVRRRVRIRKEKMKYRMKLILRGYADDVRNRRRPRRRAGEVNTE